ncbi:hypothetical protein Bca4012_091270 [Brassica carinata]|uniref:Uncharacterized protein n=1 Tax=Brassica oleracea TaxID=3712 RepID=A0A3P6G9T8_BRAOL|nr:unnamed protein product [Brassica oleracea]
MSRCFPFPPPGYEKKIRTDEADSLIKEKQKKHKKEKKDKETSKDKHKERKEKKEKHKDRKDKDRNKEKSRTSEDRNAAGVLPNTQDGEKLVGDTLQSNGNGESKFIQDLARRIRDEEEATESQSLGKIRNDDDERRVNNTHKNFAMEKRPENAACQVSSCTGQKGTEEVMFKSLEKKYEAKKMDNSRWESVVMADMPLDGGEGIKKTEPKYSTHRGSKEKKEEGTEALNKIGKGKPKDVEEGPKLKERHVDTSNFRRQEDLSRDSIKNLSSEGILGKRKDLETNGFLHENGSRPNKMLRPVASPVSSVENGRKLGACQTPLKPVTELQGTLCNPEAKEHRVNGFIKTQEPKSHPSISSVKAKENGEASAKKRPHSDLKYLDQILNVPERDEVDETEEQEWLFGQSGMKLLKKPKTDSSTSLDESQQVWNQALSIESADILALPYVVPF